MVYATAEGAGQMRRLRYGMIGGGRDAFIGAVHRMAARLDDQYELVAGALSADPEKARLSGRDLGLDPTRIYGGFEEMAKAEAARPDGIEAAVIATPNHLHAPIAKAFLAAGIDVICDKPLSLTMEEAYDLVRWARESKLVFAVTHHNTGYPMVRQAREMIAGGALGALRIVHAAYIQDWLTQPIDAEGQKQAEWRTDPTRAGLSACLADIGVHAYNLAQFVTGMDAAQVSADLATFVPGRRLDDNAHLLLRYANGAKGVLLASQVAPGNPNNLWLKVYGDKAGLEWSGEAPEVLRFTSFGEPTRILLRGGAGNTSESRRGSRIPAGHPEGLIEAFANLYRDAASLIRARRGGLPVDPLAAASVPTVIDGAKGIRFVEAAVQSSLADGRWMSAELKDV